MPDADSEGALSRLLDVLLDKGVYLDLDLVITVADVPLIAVNLRATIAGVETMLEWGVPGVWDETRPPRTVAAPRRAAPLPPAQPAAPPVEFAASMSEPRAGSTVWRPGTLLVHGDGTVQWRGDGDRRPRLTFDLGELEDAAVDDGAAAPDGPVVAVRVGGRVEQVASRSAAEIVALLAERRRVTMGPGRGS
jgi:hypothetical protein